MVDVSSAVQWWDEWQLRILVLGSLGMQWFLLLVALMRKYAIPWWFRTCIWLAYLGSDALAIYALATLFNRHARATNCDTVNGISSKGSILEVIWAPVLLIHLGGLEVITAYNIEDNELWPRHAVTLVSQVTVAVYAFYKSWPSSGDRSLLAAAILLFIIGVLSFSERPWALKSATIDSMLDVSTSLRTRKREEETCPSGVSSWLRLCFTEQGSREMIRKVFLKKKEQEGSDDPGVSERDKLHMILADMSLASADSELRNRGFRSILQQLEPTPGMGLGWVRKVFGLLYTRANVAHTPAYLAYHLLLAPSLHIAVITLLATSQKHGQNGTDLKVTYILLCFTAALDVVAVVVREVIHWLMAKVQVPPLGYTVAQYNLIDSVLRRMKPMGWRPNWAEKFCRVDRPRHSVTIASFVLGNLLDRPNVKGLDIASYRKFGENEDNWALSERLRVKCRGSEIEKSLQEPFDKSVLLWHIATHLCLRRTRPAADAPRRKNKKDGLLLWLWHIATHLCFRRHKRPADARVEEETDPRETCIEAISNYMAYLLNFRPNMLMTGSRHHLFTEASREVKSILKHSTHPSELDPKSLAEIIGRAKPGTDYYLIPHACSLAEALCNLREGDGEDIIMWDVMLCVWGGMLCYSAGMCRGYLHAKTLGEGGEFLSLVWFILSLKGVRILADKLQLPDKADGQEEPTDGPVAFPDFEEMLGMV